MVRTRRKIIASTICVSLAAFAFVVSSCSSPHQRGIKEARDKISQGKLAIETYGKPLQWRSEYNRILFERYGIENRSVAGCIVDGQILGHAEGFNSVMKKTIKQRHGKDVFDKTSAEAEAKFVEANAAKEIN